MDSTVCSSITFHPHKLLLCGWFSTGVIYYWLTNSKLVQTPEQGGLLQCGHSLLHHTLWAEGSVLWEGCCVCGVGPDLTGEVMMDNRRKVVLTTGDNVAVWDP